MKRFLAPAIAAVLISATAATAAEDYPTGTVTILVPFSSGGIVDIAARTVGQHLSERWDQEVVVENRTGGSGFIAATAAARSAPDGHTLLMADAGVSAVNRLLYDDVPYDMEADFEPLSTVSDTPLVLVARQDAPFDTVDEYVAYAQENPGELTFASAGTGTLNHLVPEWINLEADIEVRHIAYEGGAPAATAIAGGETDVGVLALSSVGPFVEGGEIKMLGVARDERVASHPDLPTIQEGGIPNVSAGQWAGLFAPAGVSEDILDKIHSDLVEVLESEEVQAQFAERGAEAIPMSREEFSAMLDELSGQFRVIIEEADISP